MHSIAFAYICDCRLIGIVRSWTFKPCTTFLLLLLNLPKYHGRWSPHIYLVLMSERTIAIDCNVELFVSRFCRMWMHEFTPHLSPKVRILLEKYHKARNDGSRTIRIIWIKVEAKFHAKWSFAWLRFKVEEGFEGYLEARLIQLVRKVSSRTSIAQFSAKKFYIAKRKEAGVR